MQNLSYLGYTEKQFPWTKKVSRRCLICVLDKANPAGKCLFKVNNRSTRTRCEIRSKLAIKTLMVLLVLVSLMLTLSR